MNNTKYRIGSLVADYTFEDDLYIVVDNYCLFNFKLNKQYDLGKQWFERNLDSTFWIVVSY